MDAGKTTHVLSECVICAKYVTGRAKLERSSGEYESGNLEKKKKQQ
jgi:hypothetical protein